MKRANLGRRFCEWLAIDLDADYDPLGTPTLAPATDALAELAAAVAQCESAPAGSHDPVPAGG